MEIKEALDIMNSDFKLWEQSETIDKGNGKVEKRLTLPWGIGEVVVTLEGLKDAGKRREAVAGYGEYIRGIIDEAISDEAVSARATQAAERAKQDDSEDSIIVSGEQRVRDEAVQEEADAPAGEAHKELATRPVGLRETLIARRVEIEDEIDYFTNRRDEAERELEQLAIDLTAIEAGLDALGAPKE